MKRTEKLSPEYVQVKVRKIILFPFETSVRSFDTHFYDCVCSSFTVLSSHHAGMIIKEQNLSIPIFHRIIFLSFVHEPFGRSMDEKQEKQEKPEKKSNFSAGASKKMFSFYVFFFFLFFGVT